MSDKETKKMDKNCFKKFIEYFNKNYSMLEVAHDEDTTQLEKLRTVRVEVNELLHLFELNAKGEIDIACHEDEIQKTIGDINKHIGEDVIEEFYRKIPPAKKDTYEQIANIWQACEPILKKLNKKEATQVSNGESKAQEDPKNVSDNKREKLREIALLKKRLEEIVFWIGYMTIPARIDAWVEVSRPGYALPLHDIFEDEVHSEEQRKAIINLLSLKPLKIHGALINPIKGIALCYPRCAIERMIRVLCALSYIIICSWAVYAVGSYLFPLGMHNPSAVSAGKENKSDVKKQNVQQNANQIIASSTDQNSQNNSNMANADVRTTIITALELKNDGKISAELLSVCWVALLLGVMAHLMVDGAKMQGNYFWQFPMPVENWTRYISARFSMILYKVTISLVVFFGMFISLNGKLQLMDAFLIGFSLDSVVGVLTASLEQKASARISMYKEKLG